MLKAAAELLAQARPKSLSIITGTSAGRQRGGPGASANNFRLAVKKVEAHLGQPAREQVYRAGFSGSAGRVLAPVRPRCSPGVGLRKPLAVLNSAPLAELLSRVIDFGDLGDAWKAACWMPWRCTASSYDSGSQSRSTRAASTAGCCRNGRKPGAGAGDTAAGRPPAGILRDPHPAPRHPHRRQLLWRWRPAPGIADQPGATGWGRAHHGGGVSGNPNTEPVPQREPHSPSWRG